MKALAQSSGTDGAFPVCELSRALWVAGVRGRAPHREVWDTPRQGTSDPRWSPVSVHSAPRGGHPVPPRAPARVGDSDLQPGNFSGQSWVLPSSEGLGLVMKQVCILGSDRQL